jgi:hypothetical protein
MSFSHSFDQSVTDMGMAGVVDTSEFQRIRSGGEAIERMIWHQVMRSAQS